MTTSTTRSKRGSGTLQEAAGGVAEEAGRTAEVTASRSMDRAADALDQLTQSLRGATSELRGQQPQLAGAMDTAVQQVDRASGYLRQHEPREIVDNVQRFAREQPAIVIGGGLAIGLALGRLLRSASEPHGSSAGHARSGYDGSRYGQGSSGAYGSGHRARYGDGSLSGGRDIGDPADAYATGGQGYGTGYGVRADSQVTSDTGDRGASIIASGTVADPGDDIDTGTDFGTPQPAGSTSRRR